MLDVQKKKQYSLARRMLTLSDIKNCLELNATK